MGTTDRTATRNAAIQFPLHSGSSRGRDTCAVPLPRVTQVMALALSFQDMISSGAAKNYEELTNGPG